MIRRAWYSCFIVAAALLCNACGGHGGGSSSASTSTYVRLVNATQVSGLQMTAGDTVVASSVAASAASSYTTLTSGSYTVVANATGGTLASSTSTTSSFSGSVYYTVVAYARGGQIKLLTITDNQSDPSTNYTLLTVANAGTDAGALDIYLAAPGSSITSISPTFSNVPGGSSSLAISVAAGTYDIVVTGYNKPSDVRLTMPSVVLTSLEIGTLVLTPTSGGSLVDAALVQQKGAVQLQTTNNAHVRVAAAFQAGSTNNSVVTASVGGTSLGSITTPSLGAYTAVPGNSTAYTVNVSGVAVASLPANTFVAGNDYTLVVYGANSAAPTVKVLTDNNQAPSTSAKLRLINLATSDAGLTFIDNYVLLFSAVTYGTASDYAGINAGSSLLQITSPVNNSTLYNNTVTILSGGVYSLFVLANANSTTTTQLLSKDR